jgi:hypothetical protein
MFVCVPRHGWWIVKWRRLPLNKTNNKTKVLVLHKKEDIVISLHMHLE